MVDEQEALNVAVAEQLAADLETETPKKRKARVTKKRKKGEEDDAYEPENDADYGRSGFSHKSRSAAGKIDFCAKCNCRFTVTVYNKVDPDGDGLLCSACGSLDTPDKAPKPKARPAAKKKRAKALLDGETSLIPTLQDTCIKLIAKHIEEVEVLGDIGHVNMDKICQIISRNRSLTDDTVPLFFDASLKDVTLYDCAKISPQRLTMLAQMCPNLSSLHLHMCGQIGDENVTFYAKHLLNLKHVTFKGCFLVTIAGWISFFETMGSRLEGFEISSTSRFNIDCVKALIANCPNVQTLSLSKLTHLSDEMITELSALQNLTSLDISHSGEAVTDESVNSVLSTVGHRLERLDLSGLRELTDNVLISGLLLYCTHLQYLNLNDLDLLTDEAVCLFFHDWHGKNPALVSLQIERCPKIKDAGLLSLLKHSGPNLRSLNINSLDEISHDAMLQLASGTDSILSQCKDLDISWIRAVDDTVVHRLLHNLTLKTLRVWGNNRITECETGSCLIIGRESV